jgi:cell division protein FtsI (penicillin-binding protein 3)
MDPKKILDGAETVHKLRTLFPQLKLSFLKKALRNKARFRWIIRHITPQEKNLLLRQGLPGVFFLEDQRRLYPQGPLFSHVVGMTDVNMCGLDGLEKVLDKKLIRSKKPVVLSLDTRLQHIVRDGLQQAITTFQAENGGAILADMHTGEILAMCSAPDFNPNKRPTRQQVDDRFFNRTLRGVYEFGSILKIHNTAMALDSGVARLHSTFDASTPLKVGRFRVTDVKKQHGAITLADAFIHSSNIVNGQVALNAGVPLQKAFFKKIGLLSSVSPDLQNASLPILPAVWDKPRLITGSYGYGFSFTPLHMIQSIARIITGKNVTLTLRKLSSSPHFERILSPRTTKDLRTLLHQTSFNIAGVEKMAFQMGMKTGTANLLGDDGKYQRRKNLTSAVAIFPIEKPRYILLTFMRHPKANHLTHGFTTARWINAPFTAQTVQLLAPILGLSPSKVVRS